MKLIRLRRLCFLPEAHFLITILALWFTKHRLNCVAPQEVEQGGGSKNLDAVKTNFQALREFGHSAAQIVSMVSHRGGSQNIVKFQRA